MLLTIEKVIILKSINLFSEISENDLLILASQLKEQQFEPDEKVITQGDIGTSMYVIVKGAVNVVVNDTIVASMKEGEVFGELSALDPEPRSATIVTTQETLLFEIENEVIENLMNEYNEVSNAIVKILCQRIRKSIS